jgi:hypothetical protein
LNYVLNINAIVIHLQIQYLPNSLLVLEIILPVLNSVNLIFYDHKIDGYENGFNMHMINKIR